MDYNARMIVWIVALKAAKFGVKRIAQTLALGLSVFFVASCANAHPVDPADAQARIKIAWEQPWHGTWELDWKQAPLPGPIVFEGWVTENAQKRRFEILEAPVPQMVGQVYVNDGVAVAYSNRLEEAMPVTVAGPDSPFSPVSDALDMVGRFLAQTPQSVEQRGSTRADPIVQYAFKYSAGQTLSVWLDLQHKRIVRVRLRAPGTSLTLAARSMESLFAPRPGLFKLKKGE